MQNSSAFGNTTATSTNKSGSYLVDTQTEIMLRYSEDQGIDLQNYKMLELIVFPGVFQFQADRLGPVSNMSGVDQCMDVWHGRTTINSDNFEECLRYLSSTAEELGGFIKQHASTLSAVPISDLNNFPGIVASARDAHRYHEHNYTNYTLGFTTALDLLRSSLDKANRDIGNLKYHMSLNSDSAIEAFSYYDSDFEELLEHFLKHSMLGAAPVSYLETHTSRRHKRAYLSFLNQFFADLAPQHRTSFWKEWCERRLKSMHELKLGKME